MFDISFISTNDGYIMASSLNTSILPVHRDFFGSIPPSPSKTLPDLNQLPDELIIRIYSKLKAFQDLLAASRVNSHWNLLMNDLRCRENWHFQVLAIFAGCKEIVKKIQNIDHTDRLLSQVVIVEA